MKSLAPICLFVYNRLCQTKQTIEALKNNDHASDSELFIFSDGAKNNEAIETVSDVRSYIQTITGFKKVQIILRERNLGLANNIISGVTEILKLNGTIIVLEDDILTNKSFLKYMNEALSLYKNDAKVASIHGYVYPIENLPDTFFIKGADCWGWATWDRAWSFFELDGKLILSKIKMKRLEREVNFNGSMDYIKMLKNQISGRNQSWAVRWHLSAYINDMLTLYPGKSFVKNIGFDSSGQHCSTTKDFDPIEVNSNDFELKKIEICENMDARKKFEIYFNQTRKSFIIRGFRQIKNIIEKVIISNINRRKIRKLLIDITPPLLMNIYYNKYLYKKRWHGSYQTWAEARAETTGYDSDVIFDKVFDSIYKVKNGVSVFERDGTIFDKVDYSWPLLTGLLMAAAKSNNRLNVVDFGGSLGSTYFQNKKIIDNFEDVKWSIIEQNKFVSIGKNIFEDENLKFYYTIDECLEEQKPNILILSSVLQYIEEPYKLLENILSKTAFDCIIIDRTPFTDNQEKIVVQKVPSCIYNASYPCRILNFNEFKSSISINGFQLFEEFDTKEGKKNDIEFKGIIYFKKSFIRNRISK